MSRTNNPTRSTVSWTKPADDWSRAKAVEMHQAGYSAGTIIEHLEAYGIGHCAAQALVRNLKHASADVNHGQS